ncbi:hypothetical protein [Streptomyces eurocidicus]|uniref:Uncharacterized protein n=1 Tax=Streptomyces eurocidicus TaxID=66423 RepID=A0A7W8BFG8_STREU|nr:hypothetical protein [Streptomyces eurocidicus]MBB5122410.1 hypothetical protein [Streptomyces eurocidicus]MBF6051694.1 hypothetical protein [Streptomyces eurocidicus]
MSARTLFRTLTVAAATATLGAALITGAQAAGPGAAAPEAASPATVRPADENPYLGIELQGLRAEQRTMYPAGHPVTFWALVLDDETVTRHYRGGQFFLYAPATGEFGSFLDTDIAVRTVRDPRRVVIADSGFMRSHPRVEVRYGNPDRPKRAFTVATATIWM